VLVHASEHNSEPWATPRSHQAWRFFELAGSAAMRGGDFSMFAFARLVQAHIVHELAGASVASQLAESIWTETRRRVSEPVHCWMAAAVAELQADLDLDHENEPTPWSSMNMQVDHRQFRS